MEHVPLPATSPALLHLRSVDLDVLNKQRPTASYDNCTVFFADSSDTIFALCVSSHMRIAYVKRLVCEHLFPHLQPHPPNVRQRQGNAHTHAQHTHARNHNQHTVVTHASSLSLANTNHVMIETTHTAKIVKSADHKHNNISPLTLRAFPTSPSADIHLLYRYLVLRDTNTLQHYRIFPGDTLTVISHSLCISIPTNTPKEQQQLKRLRMQIVQSRIANQSFQRENKMLHSLIQRHEEQRALQAKLLDSRVEMNEYGGNVLFLDAMGNRIESFCFCPFLF